MDPNALFVIAIVILMALIFWCIVEAILEARDMRHLGLILIVVGLFFGWPIMAVGAALVIAHYATEKK